MNQVLNKEITFLVVITVSVITAEKNAKKAAVHYHPKKLS